jgi:hypothetical protein
MLFAISSFSVILWESKKARRKYTANNGGKLTTITKSDSDP